MSYQVLARKWRPQSFEAVVGQPAVTRTLQHAIAAERVHHAFVFAGPRGVGKTTTARILARALNCENGPTAEPCGTCAPCVEIAEGRDMDVLEIDAATHTQVDTVREVIISGLAIMPVRDRHKVFIIDEVHQLSSASFNALLKSVEEPPPHVVFMMATTELEKIPDTILSRAQVFEFRTIPSREIAAHLRAIADAEKIAITDEAIALIARGAEGSMRDAQSALDQVMAFAGQTITLEDVTTVLGLVGRDVLFEVVNIVADEDPTAAFEVAGRVVDHGYDLRLVCRELSRLVRDLLVVSVDKSRVEDPEIAAESEREAVMALAGRFSREELLRAFDVLGRAEQEVRTSAQPRYSFEMALLRWIHLQKLEPLAHLLERLGAPGEAPARPPSSGPAASSVRRREAAQRASRPSAPAPSSRPASPAPPPAKATAARQTAPTETSTNETPSSTEAPPTSGSVKDRFLAEVRKSRAVLFNTVIAQAQSIEVEGDGLVFVFAPNHRTLREKLDQSRPWLEKIASSVADRRMSVKTVQRDANDDTGKAAEEHSGESTAAPAPKTADLKAEALADAAVQAMLDVFPAEIRDVEEI